MTYRTGSISLTVHFTPDVLRPNQNPNDPVYVTVNGHGIQASGKDGEEALQKAILAMKMAGRI